MLNIRSAALRGLVPGALLAALALQGLVPDRQAAPVDHGGGRSLPRTFFPHPQQPFATNDEEELMLILTIAMQVLH